MNNDLEKEALCCLALINNDINSSPQWFDKFCSTLLGFSSKYQAILCIKTGDNKSDEGIFLCLKQICTCIKCLVTIKLEPMENIPSSTPGQHFIDRIRLCLDRLLILLRADAANIYTAKNDMESTFFDLMDIVLDFLESSSDDDECASARFETVFMNYRKTIDEILSHALAFANVAIDEDKRALSALCQQVLRECMCLQNECEQLPETNNSNRKLKTTSLVNALYKLEDYLNRSLVRLIYTCFLDHERRSIERLRAIVGQVDETILDDFIADFDINLDRTTQIGVLASAFAPNMKIKTVVRSCLASMEALDSFAVPAVLAQPKEYMLSGILEQHFNEEVDNFKSAIQEIIDSHAFVVCYQEMLNQCIRQMEKAYNKAELQQQVEMGDILVEHFQLKSNHEELQKEPMRLECFEKFIVILRECQAILVCSEQVEHDRVLKRFKILRSVLSKLVDALQSSTVQTYSSISPSPSMSILNEHLEQSTTSAASSATQKMFPKDSLRTTIFKRKKFMDVDQINSDLTSLLHISPSKGS